MKTKYKQLDCFQESGQTPAFGLVSESAVMNRIDWDGIKKGNKPDPNQTSLFNAEERTENEIQKPLL